MYKNVLASIPGIEYYPIVALVLFFGFFIGLLIWFFITDKNRLQSYARQVIVDDLPAPSKHVTPTAERS